ncbi:MAG: hypothetical protein ACO1Q7_09400 [Gemmatimonas sp.]
MKAGVVLGALLAPLAGLAERAEAQRIVNPAISAKTGPNEGKWSVGWKTRPDNPKAADSVLVIDRGQGKYVLSGPPAIVYTPKNTISGNFVLQGILFSGYSGAAIPDGFGVFLGGRNLDGPNADFTEFLVKNTGQYGVFQWKDGKRTALKDWTTVAGINIHSGRPTESTRNTFRVIVDAQSVQLVVNRAMVYAFPRATFKPDGIYGVRVGSRQQFQIESLGPERTK